jgi:hypothetical protein
MENDVGALLFLFLSPRRIELFPIQLPFLTRSWYQLARRAPVGQVSSGARLVRGGRTQAAGSCAVGVLRHATGSCVSGTGAQRGLDVARDGLEAVELLLGAERRVWKVCGASVQDSSCCRSMPM